MLRRISILTAASAMLALSAWPASATALHPKIHSFSIPGLPGVSAWGSYHKTGSSVSVTVCVKDTSKNIDLATAIAIASDKSHRHYKGDIANAFGDGQHACKTITAKYTAHLSVSSASVNNKDKAKLSKIKFIY